MMPPTLQITIQPGPEGNWPVITAYWMDGQADPGEVKGNLALHLEQLRARSLDRSSYGQLLGEALFHGMVRERFEQAISHAAGKLRVILSVEDPVLHQVRWSYLHGPVESEWRPLALTGALTFSQRVSSSVARPGRTLDREDLGLLMVGASPSDLATYGFEQFDVDAAFAGVMASFSPYPVAILGSTANAAGPASLPTIIQHLEQGSYPILHIFCHGQDRNGKTVLYLSDSDNPEKTKPETEDNVITMLRQLNPEDLPHVIFLASCETASKSDIESGGLARRLVADLGVRAVIGMTDKISVQTANKLSRLFYKRLLKDGEADRSMAEAISALSLKHDALYPVLFSRLDGGKLFYTPTTTITLQTRKFHWNQLRDHAARLTAQTLAEPRQEEWRRDWPTARNELMRFLEAPQPGYILLGETGIGRSHFLGALAREFSASGSDHALLYYHAGRVGRDTELEARIVQDLLSQLPAHQRYGLGGQNPTLLGEILEDGEHPGDRRLVICYDGIERQQAAENLIVAIDRLVQRATRYPWVKIIVTCAPGTWKELQRRINPAADLYYDPRRPQAAVSAENVRCSRELGPLDDTEVRAALEQASAFHLAGPYLGPSHQHRLWSLLLARPAALALFCEPRTDGKSEAAWACEFFEQYLNASVAGSRLEQHDYPFLRRDLMRFFASAGWTGNLTSDQIDTAQLAGGRRLLDVIYSVKNADDRRDNATIIRLVDAGLLVLTFENLLLSVHFTQPEFMVAVGSRYLFGQAGSKPEFYEQQAAQSPTILHWYALVAALGWELRADRGPQVASLGFSRVAAARRLLLETLVEQGSIERTLVEPVLRALRGHTASPWRALDPLALIKKLQDRDATPAGAQLADQAEAQLRSRT